MTTIKCKGCGTDYTHTPNGETFFGMNTRYTGEQHWTWNSLKEAGGSSWVREVDTDR